MTVLLTVREVATQKNLKKKTTVAVKKLNFVDSQV